MDSTVYDATALLEEGAWIVGRSLELRVLTAAAERKTRELVLTFRSHRFRPIAGASDNGGENELRRRLRAFAGCRPVKTYTWQSRGAECVTCGGPILAGDVEYDVVADGLELRLDAACYLLLVDEVERVTPQG